MGKQNDNENQDGFVDLFDINPEDFGAEATEPEEPASPEGEVEEIETEVEEIEETDEEVDEPEETDEPDDDEQDDESEEESEEVSEFGSIMEELAEDGTLEFDPEKEYEPNAKGFKEIVQQTVEKAKSKFLDELAEKSDDETKEVLEIIKSGGSINDYFQSKQDVDFSKIPIATDGGEPIEQNQQHLVEDWMKIQGYEEDEIQEKLTDLKEAGLLEKEAITSRKKLAKWQESEQEKKKEMRIKERREKEENAKKMQEEFKKTITSKREIAGFKISDKEAEKLHEFITKPTKSGKTAFAEKDTEETRLLYAYFAMKGFDKEALEKEVKSKQNLKLKKALSNYSDKNAKRSSGEKRVQNNPKSKQLNLDNWIV